MTKPIDNAYKQARIDGPSKATRQLCLEDPLYSYLYARHIDKKPRKDTRTSSATSLEHLYHYTVDVDKVKAIKLGPDVYTVRSETDFVIVRVGQAEYYSTFDFIEAYPELSKSMYGVDTLPYQK